MDKLKNEIYLVTGINESYLPSANVYIETMHQNSNVKNIVITLDFKVPKAYKEKYASVKFIKMSSANVRSPNSNSCMQHGGFLPALDFMDESDIIIYTDADIKMQRGFNSDELDFLCSFRDGDIGVGYNKSENDLLLEEAQRLKPNVSIQDIQAKYPDIHELKTYNTGVLVVNYRTYKKLYEIYNKHWESYRGTFNRDGQQQWLLSYLINKHFRPRILPDLIHTHGKYPVELRVKGDVGYRFCIGQEIVVFNHAIRHKAEQSVWKLSRKIRHQRRLIRRLYIALIILVIACVFLLIKSSI